MKNSVSSFFLISSCFLLFTFPSQAQAPNWDSVYTDFFKKYSPIDTPAWLFPMCFKDGTGAWDTLYVGHDPTSTNSALEILFGETWVPMDTTMFSVALGFNSSSNPDSAIKYGVSKIGYTNNQATNNFFYVEFFKARMPVTMYWEDSLFYTDSLPFPDLSPLPNARGQYSCSDFNPNYYNCGTISTLMTDNPDSISSWSPPPSVSDSVVFLGDTIGTLSYMSMDLRIDIVPYRSESHIGVESHYDSSNIFKIYPNPSNGLLNIQSDKEVGYTSRIYNSQGQLVLQHSAVLKNVELDISHLTSGMYFIQITTEKNTVIKKIMKAS